MRNAVLAGLAAFALSGAPAHAVFFGNTQGGTDFPQGAASFADFVVSYSPVLTASGNPTLAHRGAFNGLGAPDFSGDQTCADQASCTFVSVGSGGSIVLRFDDNKLTGSGNSDLDLWIFEVGTDIEDTFVHISMDGADWKDVGKVFGDTAGIDIDDYGWGPEHQFAYVKLTDDPNEGSTSGVTVGADIDAVGAISTVLTPIPEPESYALLLAGLGLLGFMGLSRRRCR